MTEPCAALKEYAELCEAWERLGTLADAPDYEEWLEQQYDNYLRDKQIWRARWQRKAERVHELEREIARIEKVVARIEKKIL